ncbi:MAG TPA: 16S rRNA (uracil(1498)-N(3))-methyltransferase [Desulfuromonadaceae bacterium]|jgi:16S rRNA (uracil1498-N3)-methyltransferase
MSNRRFIISSRSIRDGYASFDGELFNHMVRVLRLSPGELLTLVDENGCEYCGKIDQVSKEWVAVKITTTLAPETIDREATKITICQALPKGDKIDLILQKGTELGAHDFWLFGGRRSVARLREGQCDSKLERWNRITSEAARQSGRCTVPVVKWFPTAVEAADAANQDLRLLLWEGEREQNIKTILDATARPASVIASIGPEGGFDPLEVRHFSRHGFRPATLGRRILRTETVAIAITAILQYIWDEI